MKIDSVLMTTDVAAMPQMIRDREAAGYDGCFTFEGPRDPFLPLAAAAAATSKIELGTAVAIALARSPVLCAQTANDLQCMSGGRFVLGLGSQVRAHVENRFGQPFSKPNARMREFVQALRAVWRCWEEGEPLDFRGEFYRHTMMPPLFNPGPSGFGPPPVYLAGVGAGMVRVAGDVADGWVVHPLHSREHVLAEALPVLAKARGVDGGGAAGIPEGAAGRSAERSDEQAARALAEGGFTVSAQTFCMVGDTDEEVARARATAKAQVAFYAATRVYRGVLDYHGFGGLQPELKALAAAGRWAEMVELVPDGLMDVIGVSGRPEAVGAELLRRNDFAQRTTLVLYDECEGGDGGRRIVDAVRGAEG